MRQTIIAEVSDQGADLVERVPDEGQLHSETKVSYTAPSALAARYGLTDELAARLAGIDAVTDAPR